jgi:dihydropteroate synthase
MGRLQIDLKARVLEAMKTFSISSLLAAMQSAKIPLIMGIVNRTPDSFSDGGRFLSTKPNDLEKALSQAEELVVAGAQILDVGAESTRPGSKCVPLNEERARLMPFLRGLLQRDYAWVSVDTRHAEIAAEALELGVHFVNDISAGQDPQMFPLLAKTQVPSCLMHMQGQPATMQHAPSYDDPVRVVRAFLRERSLALQALGLPATHILLDPGIGFGKTLEHNLALMRHLSTFPTSGEGVLLGASRKSFIADFDRLETHLEPPAQKRLGGSIAALAVALQHHVSLVRVHDVHESAQFLRLFSQLKRD